jgi:asparagine synthase (glutamine-hydrolysing)
MCGIAGALSATRDARVVGVVGRLTEALRHRGPDGEAFWVDTFERSTRCARHELPAAAGLALGHRRLSIVDLATGDQPIGNEDGSIWVAFNGEIYNHLELRRELEAHGHRFATRADTEVLVHGWEEWREALFPRLNGIFAFALTDRRRGVTVLVRDPVGVKPLYVGVTDRLTWWVSELGAARAAGLVTGDVSKDALKLYLLFRFIPSPAAIHEHTWKVPPGHYVLLRSEDAGRDPTFRPFCTAIRSAAAPVGRMEWRDALMAGLEGAVTRQLMSDVPVGSLLSGGVDSTLVTWMMARHLPDRPQTFGIGFHSHGDDSEILAASLAATELGVPFVPTWVSDEDYLAAWPTAFAQVSEPIGNSGGLLVHLLCRTVARTHKVVLTGQGADEPLGGYPRHMAERLRRVGAIAPRLSSWVAEALLGAEAGRRLARVLRSQDRVDRYLAIFAVLEPEAVDALVSGGAPARMLGRAIIGRWAADSSSGDDLNDLLRVDARLSLADDLLIIADHFSMQASVELRVPFLDLEFLDLAERMPSRFKVSRIGERKWLYRQGAARSLPGSLSRRLCGIRARLGRKAGFTVPVEQWFTSRGGVLGGARAWLEPLAERGLLAPSALAALADRAQQPESMQRELLALYSLSRWVEVAPA